MYCIQGDQCSNIPRSAMHSGKSLEDPLASKDREWKDLPSAAVSQFKKAQDECNFYRYLFIHQAIVSEMSYSNYKTENVQVSRDKSPKI